MGCQCLLCDAPLGIQNLLVGAAAGPGALSRLPRLHRAPSITAEGTDEGHLQFSPALLRAWLLLQVLGVRVGRKSGFILGVVELSPKAQGGSGWVSPAGCDIDGGVQHSSFPCSQMVS